MPPGKAGNRPDWTHSDGRPYDDFDFDATHVEDELDFAEHAAKLEREVAVKRLSPLRRLLGIRRRSA